MVIDLPINFIPASSQTGLNNAAHMHCQFHPKYPVPMIVNDVFEYNPMIPCESYSQL
jgi:hypothetical protein